MKNKKILMGMLIMILTFGMTFIGCDGDGEGDDSNSNPYIGIWTGKYKSGTPDEEDVTMTLTDTEWALTSAKENSTLNLNLSGIYTRGIVADFKVALKNGDIVVDLKVAGGAVAGNTLLVTFNDTLGAAYSSVFFTLTRFKETPPEPPSTDPFTGTWNGTLKKSGQQEVTVTIIFTEQPATWTFSDGGSTSYNGTYTKSNLGTTATLKMQAGNLNVTMGTCMVFLNKLTLTMANDTYEGYSGSGFTKD
jgi:hypothetical protein